MVSRGPLCCLICVSYFCRFGRLAQMVERPLRMRGGRGTNTLNVHFLAATPFLPFLCLSLFYPLYCTSTRRLSPPNFLLPLCCLLLMIVCWRNRLSVSLGRFSVYSTTSEISRYQDQVAMTPPEVKSFWVKKVKSAIPHFRDQKSQTLKNAQVHTVCGVLYRCVVM